MPFSQIVVSGGGCNTIICSAPVDLTVGGLEGGAVLINYLPTVTLTGALARTKQMESGTLLGRAAPPLR